MGDIHFDTITQIISPPIFVYFKYSIFYFFLYFESSLLAMPYLPEIYAINFKEFSMFTKLLSNHCDKLMWMD